jgi:hypothetical protein
MKRLLMSVLMAAATACATPSQQGSAGVAGVPAGITFEGGDGLSCETRVLIRGAPGGQQGVAAEYAWLRSKYPGHEVKQQALSKCGEHPADKIVIATADGRELTIHFDISEFFGKDLGL